MDFIEFFTSGIWWPTLIGILISGIIIAGFLDLYKSFLFGIVFGIILAIGDLIIGSKLGYSFLEGICDWIEDLVD